MNFSECGKDVFKMRAIFIGKQFGVEQIQCGATVQTRIALIYHHDICNDFSRIIAAIVGILQVAAGFICTGTGVTCPIGLSA